MIFMVPITFMITTFKHNLIESFTFAVAIAITITPLLLPVILSSSLAKGARKMSKKKTIVKKLDSIQNFGSMNILCTDKTGTLTEDKIVLEKYLNFNEVEDKNVLKSVFSSKNIGGNILEDGCSQEEIVFLKCPECMVGLLLSPVLNATESFRITNIIQYSEVLGYATEINFQGNIASQKIQHDFVFFDALICVDKKLQYSQYGIDRELNKAYSAMRKVDEYDSNQSIATGKFGCGSILGDARLKFIIQLLASSLSGRQMRYHTLNDTNHKQEIIHFMNMKI